MAYHGRKGSFGSNVTNEFIILSLTYLAGINIVFPSCAKRLRSSRPIAKGFPNKNFSRSGNTSVRVRLLGFWLHFSRDTVSTSMHFATCASRNSSVSHSRLFLKSKFSTFARSIFIFNDFQSSVRLFSISPKEYHCTCTQHTQHRRCFFSFIFLRNFGQKN